MVMPLFMPLTIQFPSDSNGFICQAWQGYLAERPQIIYCQVCFNANKYCDDLFVQLDINFPERLINAVKKRRAEYLAGRYCVQQVLSTLGMKNIYVASDVDRMPVWPLGIAGSLSHSKRYAIALVASAVATRFYLGVDTETSVSRKESTGTEMVLNMDELRLLKQCGLPFELAFTVAFSMKESLYKALYPEIRRFFGFECASITILSIATGTVTLTLMESLSDVWQIGKTICGRFTINYPEVTTVIVMTGR